MASHGHTPVTAGTPFEFIHALHFFHRQNIIINTEHFITIKGGDRIVHNIAVVICKFGLKSIVFISRATVQCAVCEFGLKSIVFISRATEQCAVCEFGLKSIVFIYRLLSDHLKFLNV